MCTSHTFLLVFLLLCTGCTVSSSVPLLPDSIGSIPTNLYRIPVILNQNENVEMLIDTGATFTGLPKDILTKVGAKKTQKKVIVFSATGKVEYLYEYIISALSIGECSLVDVPVIAIPDDEQVVGFLGFDVFSRILPIRIDAQYLTITC